MKILILNWKDIKNPVSGGAEIVTHEHAKRWVRKGNDVVWLTSSFKGAKKQEETDGIKIVRFGNIYTLLLYAPIFYLFSGQRFDLVIDEVHGIPFFTPFYVRKRKLVLIHEIAGDIWDQMYPFPFNIFGKILEKFYLLVYRNQKFWTDAKATIEELVRHGIKKENCIAIPCPSNLLPLSEIPLKSKYPTFITISRLVKMKGIEEVLMAFSFINKDFTDSELLVVGSGKEKYIQSLKVKAKDLGIIKKVKFMGFVDEKTKERLLKSSNLLLHASVKEGWGIVVIEAASQATPSVVYNVPGLSESVKNSETGIVITANTAQELAAQSIKLIKDEARYKRLQQNALDFAKSLSWDEFAKQSLNFVKNV